ncbi:MAG: TonB-dependent receptor [Methylococcaceae bacterium]|nr:TonB-dependent receptor [Methylococcaceae bacterium]
MNLPTFCYADELQEVTNDLDKEKQVNVAHESVVNDDVRIAISQGYRQDSLSWSIAGQHGFPNVQSELKWRSVTSWVTGLGGEFDFKPGWTLGANLISGSIFTGTNQDSDFNGNNRTGEFSQTQNSANSGKVIDLSFKIAYKLIEQKDIEYWPPGDLQLQFGLGLHQQDFTITDGVSITPETGKIFGLNSRYKTEWLSPWIGLENNFIINDNYQLLVGFQYHRAYFDATANWNLRTDLKHPESFRHRAEGYGFKASVNNFISLSNSWKLNLSIQYQYWQADKNGKDTLFFANGRVVTSKLNEVNWSSYSIGAGIVYSF